MIKFYKCTSEEYKKLWLKERIQNFLQQHSELTDIDQIIVQFLKENQNEDLQEVKRILQEIF